MTKGVFLVLRLAGRKESKQGLIPDLEQFGMVIMIKIIFVDFTISEKIALQPTDHLANMSQDQQTYGPMHRQAHPYIVHSMANTRLKNGKIKRKKMSRLEIRIKKLHGHFSAHKSPVSEKGLGLNCTYHYHLFYLRKVDSKATAVGFAPNLLFLAKFV